MPFLEDGLDPLESNSSSGTDKDLMLKLKRANKRIKDLENEVLQLQKQLEDNGDKDDDDDDLSAASAPPSDPWEIKYRELRQYRAMNGDCRVQRRAPTIPLGDWVMNQRKKYKSKTMPTDRIVKLDAIGFIWGKDHPAPTSWEDQYKELLKFHKAFGHVNVPMNPSAPSSLAKWVSCQRTEYRRSLKGSDSMLTLDQIQLLKDVGFNFKGPRLDKM